MNILEFEYDSNSDTITDNNGIIWDVNGINTANDNILEPVVYMDVFWAGWVGFFPDTELIMN